jgi:hypothetical protein
MSWKLLERRAPIFTVFWLSRPDLQTLDLAVVVCFKEDARVGRAGRIDRNGENDTDDAGVGESHVSKGARHEAPAAQLCLRQHARSLDFARDDRTWHSIDRAAERLSKENERAE